MDIQLLVQTLVQKIEQLEARIKTLEAENALLKNKKNSNNSHIPPSQDQNRPRRNQSLREPTDRKAGGQPGHEGTTLQCSSKVDETIKHSPVECSRCGNNLDPHPEELVSTRQLIDIPTIVLKCKPGTVWPQRRIFGRLLKCKAIPALCKGKRILKRCNGLAYKYRRH